MVVGLNDMDCNTLAQFIATASPTTGKKSIASAEISAEEQKKLDDEEAKVAAATAIHYFFPGQVAGIEKYVHADAKKRQSVGSALLSQLQVCSPLIAAGLNLIENEFKLPINVTGALGPCGEICDWALCGLNILCQNVAFPLLKSVNSNRLLSGCSALACASFLNTTLINVCGQVTCPHPNGYWQATTNCLPPQQVHNPSLADTTDCCQTCTDPCNGVRCPALSCPAPTFPLCYDYTIGKYNQFDCCTQCIDPCATKKAACAATPTSCPAGSVLGPGHIGDCCLSCQPSPCLGVNCNGTPASQANCPAGSTYQAPPASPTSCGNCCGSCVKIAGTTIVAPTTHVDASTVSIAGAVLAAAAAVVSL